MQLQIVAHAVHFNQPGNSQSLPFKITKKQRGPDFVEHGVVFTIIIITTTIIIKIM